MTFQFDVVAEQMIHISRFQLLLRIKERHLPFHLDQLQISTKEIKKCCSLVEIYSEGMGIVFSAVFPRSLTNVVLQSLDEISLQLSLPYEEDLTTGELGTAKPLTPIEMINEIQCNSCQQRLLPCKSIQRTCELPVGHWDEIADYLICYNGQPVVDFTVASMATDPGMALQDANVLCLHATDLTNTASVLPVPGYGEMEDLGSKQDEKVIDTISDPAATVRGDRYWRDASVGASVCCSNCSSPLGFASIESPECFRLLKHRLSIPTTVDGRQVENHPLSSCASFLAREMVRYAEAKAIFTFIVTLDMPQMSFASNVYAKCILLRLVSWDCNIATNFEGETSNLNFRRYAKLVFEETYDRKARHEGTWVWGGVDLCCPAPTGIEENSTSTADKDTEWKVSTARIALREEEYLETLKCLRAGQVLFPTALAAATILVKMGTMPSSNDESSLGLTAIPLYG